MSVDVKAIDYRYPVTTVPAKKTTVMNKFMTVNLPEGTSEHVIAFEPIIDNAEIVHHIDIFGCRDEQCTYILM